LVHIGEQGVARDDSYARRGGKWERMRREHVRVSRMIRLLFSPGTCNMQDCTPLGLRPWPRAQGLRCGFHAMDERVHLLQVS
jgi:hypothetical protein